MGKKSKNNSVQPAQGGAAQPQQAAGKQAGQQAGQQLLTTQPPVAGGKVKGNNKPKKR